jgi:sec-independent protein translocase protein TatA
MNIGWTEVVVIALLVLVLFGAKRIPEMMKSMGQGIKEFKKAARDISAEDDTPSAPKAPSAPANDETHKTA